MLFDKKVANKVLTQLDTMAAKIESLAKSGKVDKRVASSLVKDIDSFADRFQLAVYGKENFENFQNKVKSAAVLKRDKDEQYMDTFENPQKVLQSDDDEPYMHHTGPTFNDSGMPTFDSDDTSQVMNRNEHNVRDLNPLSDGTKKQPSWAKGPNGKSTHTGSRRRNDW